MLVPYVLCLLYGVPSGFYRLHHCIMHHVVSSCEAGGPEPQKTPVSGAQAMEVGLGRHAGSSPTHVHDPCRGHACALASWLPCAASMDGMGAALPLCTHPPVTQPACVPCMHTRAQEDNAAPLDLSSTEPYQRDNFLHFLRCGRA